PGPTASASRPLRSCRRRRTARPRRAHRSSRPPRRASAGTRCATRPWCHRRYVAGRRPIRAARGSGRSSARLLVVHRVRSPASALGAWLPRRTPSRRWIARCIARPRGSECRLRLHVVADATTVARRSRPDPRARRVLAVAVVAVVAGQLAAGLVLDAAPPSVRFAEGARALARARAVGNAPYVLLLGSSRFWKIDLDTARQTLLETVGGAAPQVVQEAVMGGEAVIADYLLERLLAAGSRPVLIVAETSPETIGHPSNWIAGDAIRFFTWRDILAWAPEIAMRGKPGDVVVARLAPIDTYRRELLTWIVGRPPPYLAVAPSAIAHG